MDLLAEILEEEGVHRALEPDMELADQTFGHREELNLGEG